MKKNQRYFPVVGPDGKLLPHFIAVRNGGAEHLDIVRQGNEGVLRARYADADYFFKADTAKKLEEFLPRLDTLTFQEQLGSMLDKSKRLESRYTRRKLKQRLAAEVLVEGLVVNYHFGESELLVEDQPQPLGTEQSGVELDRTVQAALLHQIARDGLDLVRRAAVHRRQRDRVGDPRRDLEVGPSRVAIQRVEIVVVAGAFGQGQVQVESNSVALTGFIGIARKIRIRKFRCAVQRDGQHVAFLHRLTQSPEDAADLMQDVDFKVFSAPAKDPKGRVAALRLPKGGELSLPFVYSNEVWTGIEYQVASHLMLLGHVKEGLDIVRECRKRYDGLRRNP